MEIRIKDLITDKISGEWGDASLDSGGVNIIRTTNFTNLGKIDFSNIVLREIDIKKIEQKKLQKGDIIIEKSGGSPTQPVGRVVYFDKDDNEIYLCNNFTTVLRPDTLKIDPKYFFYQLFIGHIRGKTLKYQNKTTGIINLKLDNYLNEKILVPSVQDQIRISTVLTKAETLIQQRKESIYLLDEYLQSTFSIMFGDTVRNEKKWIKVPLNKFGTIITGNTPPRNNLDNFSEDFIEWIKTDNIVEDDTLVTQSKEYLSYEGLKKSRFVEKGALLVACIAGSIDSVGRASLTDRKVSFNQQINAIQPNDEINPYYLYWLFKNSKEYVQKHATKGMKTILTKGLFEKILMIKPPIELQNQFAYIVEKVEVLKGQFKSSLIELENLFGSLSQRAFKGELDLSALRILFEEEEYQNYVNDRTEPDHFPEPKIIVEFPQKNSQSVITPQMQAFIKSTNALSKIMPSTLTTIKLPANFEKLSQQIEQINRMMTPFEKLPKIPESVSQAMKTFESIKSFTATLQVEKKSAWSDIKGLGNLTGIVFNEIEGLAVIEKEFSKKRGGFTFQDFEKFLKKEKFKYTYKELQQFIFKQIQEKKLIQHFWSNDRTNRLQQERDGKKAILYLDESIRFVCNNSKLSK